MDDRERWNEKHASAEGPGAAPALLDEALAILGPAPPGRRALDLACGLGAASLALARAGFRVTAVDVSDVALARVAASAHAEGLAIETAARDLERDAPPA